MSISFSEAFRDRRIFVTGSTGFKGSWLVLWLHRLGAQVSGYALAPPTTPSNYVASHVSELLTAAHEADVRDQSSVDSAITAANPDVIFHMAAQPLVRASYSEPVETFSTNILGTVCVLEAVRKHGRPCVVVVVTSDKCYHNTEQVWGYRESDPLGGMDPYSASKAGAELVVQSYRASYFPVDRIAEHGVRVASCRAGNVIGGGDWSEDRIIPDAVRAVTQRESVPVRNPTAVRCWQHVLEPLSGYLLLASRMLESNDPRWCQGWNFGPLPGTELRVGQLMDHFCAAWESAEWRDVKPANAPHEASTLRLCIDKALWSLDWQPRWTVETAVERTVEWYQAFYGGGHAGGIDMREKCLEDIQRYEASIEAS